MSAQALSSIQELEDEIRLVGRHLGLLCVGYNGPDLEMGERPAYRVSFWHGLKMYERGLSTESGPINDHAKRELLLQVLSDIRERFTP